LLYRRAWRDLAVTKGWTQTPGGDPVQSVVAQQSVSVAAGGTLPEIPGVPVLDMRGMLLLMFAVVLSALLWRRQVSPPG